MTLPLTVSVHCNNNSSNMVYVPSHNYTNNEVATIQDVKPSSSLSLSNASCSSLSTKGISSSSCTTQSSSSKYFRFVPPQKAGQKRESNELVSDRAVLVPVVDGAFSETEDEEVYTRLDTLHPLPIVLLNTHNRLNGLNDPYESSSSALLPGAAAADAVVGGGGLPQHHRSTASFKQH